MLVCCPADTRAKSIQLVEYGISRGSPGEGLAVGVVRGDEVIDLVDQVFDRRERAASDRLVGDQAEEAFDLVEPGAVGGNEMHVPPGSGGQPGAYLRMGVRGVVVDDAVDVELGRYRLIDGAQERHELLMPMARLALGEHRAIKNLSLIHISEPTR